MKNCRILSLAALLLLFAFAFQCSYAQTSGPARIAVYFNTPVNNSVSTGVNAVYLPSKMADTLIAYINRAKYTIDIAQYDYNQSSGFANIATAINNAYAAGKRIRWIYDGSQSNTGLALLNPGIPTVGSPTTSHFGIMHDKFVIIDANSSNPNDAIVSTGSEDWGVTQFNQANNNILFIQDSNLAHAYRDEFNMMWGDTGMVPNATLAKFGPDKTDLGAHTFTIAGKTVELYFSPSDNTDAHITSTINTANTDLYFGVFTFTKSTDANAIVTRHGAGVYTLGIVDQNSIPSSAAYPILTADMGTALKTVTTSVIYHNKMLIVDPSNTCSDPLVLTGSHNWTTAADTKNDENTLIIHNDTIANIYYQSFYGNYTALGGTLTAIPNCCGMSSALSTSSVTTTSAVLNWSAVGGAISYNIRYRQTGTTIWTTTTSATTSVSVAGLTPTITYEFQVQTVCASGTSTFTSSTNFTTLTSCGLPSGLSATSITTTAASLGWGVVAGATSYNIQYRQTGTTIWSTTVSPTNSVGVSGLTPTTTYEFQVQTVCASGTSAFTSSTNFTTLTPCGLPSGLTAGSITTSAAVLSWSSVTGATGYNIQYRQTGTTIWSTTLSPTNSVSVSGLSPATTYEFQVQTACPSGTSSFTLSAIFTTLALPPCSTSSGLTSSSVTSSSATLSWGVVSGATSYNIQYRPTGTTIWSSSVSLTNSVGVAGLLSATTYEYEVQTICGAGMSAFTSSATFTTLAAPCTVPVGLTVTAITTTSAMLNWTAVSGSMGYNIRYRPTGTTTWSATSSLTNSVALSSLKSGVTYEYQLEDICTVGTTGFSTSSYFLTAAITCPVPSTLTATSITNTSAVWGWSAIAGALSYNVQYRVAGTIPWTVIASPANSVIVATLTPATTYEFQVEAVCPSGELSGFSGSKTFTTTNKALLTLGSGQDNNFIIYPNPVTQYATLSYSLGTSAQVSVVIYNVLGQEVLPVVKNETQSPGSHEYSTGLLPAGIYYVKCTIGESVVTRKMVKL